MIILFIDPFDEDHIDGLTDEDALRDPALEMFWVYKTRIRVTLVGIEDTSGAMPKTKGSAMSQQPIIGFVCLNADCNFFETYTGTVTITMKSITGHFKKAHRKSYMAQKEPKMYEYAASGVRLRFFQCGMCPEMATYNNSRHSENHWRTCFKWWHP